jgi:anti-sigma factor RsiW
MNAHVEPELLAYLDEELDERGRAQVEAHLATCSRCAAELERLRALRQELGATFDAALSPVRLPAEADKRIREFLRQRLERRTRRRPWLGLWQQRGLIAQGLLAMLILFFAVNTAQVLSLPAPAAPHQTLVLGQDQLAPGSQAALRVIVQSTEEAETIAGADVVVKIGRAPGQARIVYAGQTDASGTANVSFTVPQDLQGQADLVVETASAGGVDRIVSPIVIERDYKLLLNSDKPAYRPGQTIHMRTLALDAVNLKPAASRQIAFTVEDPQGQRLADYTGNASEFGIAAFNFALPPDALHGQYTLQTSLDNTISERTVTVGDYDLPAFHVTLETERDYYAPGERVTGTVQAAYFFGQPVVGGKVTLRGYTTSPRGDPARIVQGETGADGVFRFEFVLPVSFGASTTAEPAFFDLEADVIDTAGQRAGMRHFLPVTVQTILIRAVPEGGQLKPGVENVVFIMTAYPDGQPAQTTLTIEAEGRTQTLATGPYGLAEFRYVPGTSDQITVRAKDARGNQGDAAFSFQRDSLPQVLLLRTERVAYEVGDTLRAEALTSGLEESTQTIYLDVIRTRQTVATLSAQVEDGRATFALDLDERMVGMLELHAYAITANADTFVRDTRLVIVDAPRQVAVAVSADQESYHPGDTAHVQVRTALTSANDRRDESASEKVALGIGVVDESVYALETMPPGFVRAYFLIEDELAEQGAQGPDLPTLLDAEEEVRETQEKAARAAWAGVPGTDFSLAETSTAKPAQDIARAARSALANRVGLVLAALPLLLSGVVAQGLRLSGCLKRALRRVFIGALILFVASPVVGLIAGGVMLLLWTVLGVGAPMTVLVAIVALLIWVAIHGWHRRDTRAQLAAGLLAAYIVLAGLLITLAACEGDPADLVIAWIVITFLLAVAALATLGQGWVLEGRRATGWATTALALLLIPLAVYLPFVPGTASDLTRALGNPVVYAGPVGWLTGCCPAESAVIEKEVLITQIVEKEGETVVITEVTVAEPTAESAPPEAAPTKAPPAATTKTTEPAAEATSAPEPTAEPLATGLPTAEPPLPTEAPIPTPTAVPLPTEPYPLRQVFPETLYWVPEAITGEDGTLALDLPLADSVTTWRLTALASTREGDLGAATYDIVVFQDFFAQLDLPQAVTQGEAVTVTVTLYNYLDRAQTIQLSPQPAGWYTLESPPQAPTLTPSGIASTAFVIRAEEAGDFALQVSAAGEGMSDVVVSEVTVVETP